MKDDILQKNWLNYLKWWKLTIHDEEKEPTEDHFWVWYCLHREEPTTNL